MLFYLHRNPFLMVDRHFGILAAGVLGRQLRSCILFIFLFISNCSPREG